MKKKRHIALIFLLIGVVLGLLWFGRSINLNPSREIGSKVDSLHGVYVYYNGGVSHVSERNTTADGYNLGLKYQCVEFVKRYYFEHFDHRMPDSYGNAKDFFQSHIADGAMNEQRNLVQYMNPSSYKPQVSDLLIWKGSMLNPYGHVAIISEVTENFIEIIQQNPGPFSSSRERFALTVEGESWRIENDRVLGWLRARTNNP